jgi:fluoride exporter
MTIKTILIIGLGGALGSILRFLLQKIIYDLHPVNFPWGTLLVNISGCFLIGVFFGLAEKGNLLSTDWRLFLTTGFCGGFTTFSSFAWENIQLVRTGHLVYGALYIAASLVLGIFAAFFGIWILKSGPLH